MSAHICLEAEGERGKGEGERRRGKGGGKEKGGGGGDTANDRFIYLPRFELLGKSCRERCGDGRGTPRGFELGPKDAAERGGRGAIVGLPASRANRSPQSRAAFQPPRPLIPIPRMLPGGC